MRRSEIALALSAVVAAAAAVAEEKKEALSEVVVEGEAQTLPSVLTLPISQIEVGIPADGGELLRGLPGVSGSRMGGHGIDPIIRGQGQNRLNIMLDGAYIHGGCPNRMDPPTAYAPLDFYDEVTVIRGSQTVRYGGGGSGGSVLFTRRTPRFGEDEQFRGKILGGLMSNSNTQDISADLAAGTAQAFLRGLAFYKAADNYEDGDGNEVRSAYHTKGASVIAGWTPAHDQRLEVSYEANRERDVLFAGAGMDAPISDADTWRLRYEQGDLPGAFANLSAELYQADVYHVMDNYSLRTQTAPRKMLVDSTSDTDGGRLSTDIETTMGTWTLGVDYQKIYRDAPRYWDMGVPTPTVLQSYMWPGAKLEQPGIFAELALPVGAADQFSAGLRYDAANASIDQDIANTRPPGPAIWQRSPNELYQEYYGVGGEDADENNIGGFLRYEHALQGGWRVNGGLSRVVRTADATERYLAANSPDPTLRWVGNPGLAPEKHHQLELGLSGGGGNWSLAASLFYNRVDDYILRDRAHGQPGILSSDGATIYRNVEARLFGGELEGDITWSGPWSSHAVIAYVNAQNLTDDRPIAQIPPLEGSLSLDYRQSSWNAGALLRWSATQTRVDDDPATGSGQDPGETPGWAVLDLHAEANLGSNGKLFFGINNVFDKNYAYHVNRANVDPFNPESIQVNEPGREFWVRASLEF